MPGIGPARLIITAVGGNGLVEGRMEFELKSFVSTFSDKADMVKNTNRGVVSESTLIIDSALGGTYELHPWGDQRAASIGRATDATYWVAVTFATILTRKGRSGCRAGDRGDRRDPCRQRVRPDGKGGVAVLGSLPAGLPVFGIPWIGMPTSNRC